jgi:ABC-type phosphate/phosphonate transport system substrate-binding protein
MGRSWLWTTLILIGLLSATSKTRADEPQVVRVGMVKSLFRDVPESAVRALVVPFGALVYQHTGLNGQIHIGGDAFQLASHVDKGKMDLGLFQGFEFAWVQRKFPKLKPLMIAVDHQPYVSVLLVARSDSDITSFHDLKGKRLSLPMQGGGRCCLYLDRQCEKENCTPEKFFAKFVKHDCIEHGLDDVATGKVDAVIVDSLSLQRYGVVHPARALLLKTVDKTVKFPAPVVVYREGGVDEQTLDTFQQGMLKANKSPESRGLMSLWRLTAFAAVPDDYQQSLDSIRKAFPAATAPAATITAKTTAAGEE